MAALIGADVLSKILALRTIAPLQGFRYPFGGIGVFDVFCMSCSLNTVVNTGAAWGVFPNHFNLLLALRVCAVIAIAAYLLYFKSAGRSQCGLWLIAAGATGNIIDMFRYGYVIDFIHLRFFGWSFPVFNIADSCITIGVMLLLIRPYRSRDARISDAR